MSKLQRATYSTMRQAAREYIRERVTGRRRELKRETDAEIREAMERAEGGKVDTDSLGGVESDGDYWKTCAAEMVNDLAAGYVLPNVSTQGGE